MPATHAVALAEKAVFVVLKNGASQLAHVLQRRDKEVYVHYLSTDKRLDEWIPEEDCHPAHPPFLLPHDSPSPSPSSPPPDDDNDAASGSRSAPLVGSGIAEPETPNMTARSNENGAEVRTRKRKRGRPPNRDSNQKLGGPSTVAIVGSMGSHVDDQGNVVLMTEEDYDIHHHKQITAQRNFDKVHFGEWQIRTWYFSPYPLTETEIDEPPPVSHIPKIPGVHKTTARSHGRTSDLLAGGLGRNSTNGEKASLWVCQQCFKYMADGSSYDLHARYCAFDYPPGVRVYQRGAHSIWEVDGAKQKLYCQNLSLFGKLFIDVKTLFFDCDNFLFYILTESTSKQDHMLGFFSKEKVSFDDYNLACIMTLPPYQRKGYGMLMIEFSYELSRRTGRVGTPERPLSDLGLRSYLAYWVSTLIRFFRQVLTCLPPDTKKVTSIGGFLGTIRSPSGESEEMTISSMNGVPRKKKKTTKGWAGEVEDADPDSEEIPVFNLDDPNFTTQRVFETEHNEDGGATTNVSMRCTLGDIARATNLREEDAAFALNEVGLLMRRVAGAGEENDDDDDDDTVVISRALVEKVARERSVKRPCMRMAFVRL